MCGDFALAAEVFAPLARLHPDALRKMGSFNLDERTMRGESAILSSPARSAFEEGEKAYARVDLRSASAAYAKAASLAPAPGQPLLSGRIAVVQTEEALAAGEWVKLIPQPELLDWTVHSGEWSADAAGHLLNQGKETSAFIYHQARVGGELEMRAEFECSKTRHNFCAGALMAGFRWPSGPYWLTCQVRQYDDDGTALLMDRFFNSRIPERSIRLQALNKLFLRVSQGLVAFECNGERIYDNIKPGSASVRMAGGRVGIGSDFFAPGQVTTISNLEVRRLTQPAK